MGSDGRDDDEGHCTLPDGITPGRSDAVSQSARKSPSDDLILPSIARADRSRHDASLAVFFVATTFQ
jgi:hypothetical protein